MIDHANGIHVFACQICNNVVIGSRPMKQKDKQNQKNQQLHIPLMVDAYSNYMTHLFWTTTKTNATKFNTRYIAMENCHMLAVSLVITSTITNASSTFSTEVSTSSKSRNLRGDTSFVWVDKQLRRVTTSDGLDGLGTSHKWGEVFWQGTSHKWGEVFWQGVCSSHSLRPGQ